MGIKLLINAIGTLFPIIFPNQKFKPGRAIGVVVCFLIATGAIHWLGVDNATQALDLAKQFMDLMEE